VRAVIDEANCIGCTLCIQACPVDAIVGAAKLMHTVIADHCTGCELCIPPCPVDCIDLLPTGENGFAPAFSQLSKQRYLARNARLQRDKTEGAPRRQAESAAARKQRIVAAAIATARARKPVA
jgi:electron transport complex protein RnfB